MRVLVVWRILLASSFLTASVVGFSATSNSNNQINGRSSKISTATSKAPVLTTFKQERPSIAKPFRTRKQISEFRRRKLLGESTFRVSAHIPVDEFATSVLFPAVLDTLPSDWQGDDFYDGVRLWRQEDSEMNGDAGAGSINGQGTNKTAVTATDAATIEADDVMAV
jgi:hypothetical protein